MNKTFFANLEMIVCFKTWFLRKFISNFKIYSPINLQRKSTDIALYNHVIEFFVKFWIIFSNKTCHFNAFRHQSLLCTTNVLSIYIVFIEQLPMNCERHRCIMHLCFLISRISQIKKLLKFVVTQAI